MANDRPFFATAEEQRQWLGDVVRDRDLWCVAVYLGDKRPAVLDQRALEHLSFEAGVGPVRLCIGRTELAPGPVWRAAGSGSDVDFIRSRAVQYNPSLQHGNTLLQGQLGIMRREYYEEAALAYEPLHRWFTSLTDSFESALHVKGATMLSRAGRESWVRLRDKILISPGAIVWREGGGLLKQVYESVVEFDVALAGSSQRPRYVSEPE